MSARSRLAPALPHPAAGSSGAFRYDAVVRRVIRGLPFAAAPLFALMAILTAGMAPSDPICMAASPLSSLSGMAVMYGLMSVVHATPWLRWIVGRSVASRH